MFTKTFASDWERMAGNIDTFSSLIANSFLLMTDLINLTSPLLLILSIGIFPEGGSHDRSELLPLKAGVALMALVCVLVVDDSDSDIVLVLDLRFFWFFDSVFRWFWFRLCIFNFRTDFG